MRLILQLDILRIINQNIWHKISKSARVNYVVILTTEVTISGIASGPSGLFTCDVAAAAKYPVRSQDLWQQLAVM